MNTQKARNTAAGMVRDALEQLTKWERVQDLRHFNNTKDEATRLLDLAEGALSYFEHHYDFPECRNFNRFENVHEAGIAFAREYVSRQKSLAPVSDFRFSAWLYEKESEVTK